MNTLKAAGITALAFAVLSCPQLRAQWNTTPYVPVHNNLYTATGNMWRTDHSFQSTIHLTNRLITQPMDVTVTLYMADGTPYVLPVVHLAKSGVAEVSVNAALASAPAAVLSHVSQSGSATLQYRYDWAGAVRGSTTILDSVRSLQYTNSFRFPETVMNSASSGAAATMTGPHVLQGLWWKYSPQSSVFVSAANTTSQQMQATIAVVDQQQNALGSRQIVLGPQASTLTALDDIIGSSPSTLIGGVQITYSGNPGALLFSGGLEDDAAGYSAAMPLGMAMMPMTTTATVPGSCTAAAAGLMVGPAGAMMGFPSGVTFHPYGFARNIGTASLTLHSSVNYMDSSGPHTLALPDQALAAGQALNLQLNSVVQLPATVGSVNLSFNVAGDCSTLLLATGSVDTTGNYVFEVAPTGVAPGNGRQMLHWQVGNGYDSMFSLWNPSSQSEDLLATVYFEPQESTYTVPITLAPNASTMLDIMGLIEAAKPDVNGNTIPAGAHIGSVVVAGVSPDLRDTVTFVAAGGVYNPLSGTCGIICTDCTGAVSGDLSPASPSVAADHTQAFTFYVNNSNGTQTNYTSTADWSSSETSVATVQSGQASAVSSGSTEISAKSPSVPDGEGEACIDGDETISSCMNIQYTGETTLTVYDDTPSNISVSPSSYTVGTATGFTITGQNLGTNCPQLTWPFAASYSLSSCANTSVSGTATANAAGSGDLTFKAEGYGGQGFSPGPGQGQTAQSTAVSATAPCAVPTSLTSTAGQCLASGELDFTYSWSSSSGKMSDLSSCYVGEYVTYSGSPPSPPFPSSSGFVNPTINPPLGTNDGYGYTILDHNLPPSGSFVTPYASATFNGTQTWRYNCACQGTPGVYTSFPGYGSVAIQRQVTNSSGSWQYVITKQGSTCTLKLP